jgi:hypothetical protein
MIAIRDNTVVQGNEAMDEVKTTARELEETIAGVGRDMILVCADMAKALGDHYAKNSNADFDRGFRAACWKLSDMYKKLAEK